jgi:hypothetical protein
LSFGHQISSLGPPKVGKCSSHSRNGRITDRI